MRLFAASKKILDRALEVLVIVAMAVLVLDVVWQVVTRYVLKHPCSWTEELATFLMIWVGLLGASVGLNRKAHLGVDYITMKLSPKKRAYVELFAFLMVAVFSLLVLVMGGIELVKLTLESRQVSPSLGWKMGYVYLALPISGFFLVLYSGDLFVETLAAISKGDYARKPDGSESTEKPVLPD